MLNKSSGLRTVLLLSVGLGLIGSWRLMADPPPRADRRAAAEKALQEGNFLDAFDTFQALCLEAGNGGAAGAQDFENAISCLTQLQRLHEIDAFREAVADKHSDDWRVLQAVARSDRSVEHGGFLIAGTFHRGYHDQGGQYVSAEERDRVRGLQLEFAAQKLIGGETDASQAAAFYKELADALAFGRISGEAWKLQTLTDLSQLPDYEELNRWGWRGWSPGPGAPVDAEGKPVLYHVPDSLAAARNDGERWRWCLQRSAELDARLRPQIDWEFAQFLQSQFSVATLAQSGIQLATSFDEHPDQDDPRANIWSLHSLDDSETIARLATGAKRLSLPEEFNHLLLFKKIAAAAPPNDYSPMAQDTVAHLYQDRQQYVKAAEAWRTGIEKFRTNRDERIRQLNQIIKPWGTFEGIQTQPAVQGVKIPFRFRNGRQLKLVAHRLKTDVVLQDLKAYLKSNPEQLDWNQLQIENFGYRIVQQNEQKYLGEKVATWSVDLDPRPEHFDRRMDLATPLQKAGAYLVVAQLEGGNISRIVVWVADTAIVKKTLADRNFYYVADAVSGVPLANVNVELFGWRQDFNDQTKRHHVQFKNFAEKTDKNGEFTTDGNLMPSDYQWMAVARTDTRLAFLGFSGAWYPGSMDSVFDQIKTIVITDRPVYRPEQKVQFKFWVRKSKYDLTPEESRAFAQRTFMVQLVDPLGTEIWKKPFTSDDYGGFSGEYDLPEDAKLGVYSIQIVDDPQVGGGGNWRVEEYKKPEFTVSVDAPDKPVKLGDRITATIHASYLFGAPVTNATVHYKVQRSAYAERWFPSGRWDWLYGPGYWWFESNDMWYPGFARWGCQPPIPTWWNWSPEPPELVLDVESPIGADGELKVEIDTSLAQALHGDEDHRYEVTAEITDSSRRTIVGQGVVLVAREPFKVFTWLDQGHYAVGDMIRAQAQVRTLDGRAVAGHGVLKLLKVSYAPDGTPAEAEAGTWEVDPDAEGRVDQEIKASEAGQYRLSYSLTYEEPGQPAVTREGGTLFVIRGDGFDGSKFHFDDLEVIPDKREYKPGEQVQLLINTDQVNSTVLLFVRPVNGVCPTLPQLLKLSGKSLKIPVAVMAGDMPNFFIEAVTVAQGRVHTVVREVVVPPAQRVLNVDVTPSAGSYKPGQKAEVDVRLTELNGEPFQGSLVMSIYDKAVEYISGGTNVPDLREFFWKWRRSHNPSTEHNLARGSGNLQKPGEESMADLGAFGSMVADFDEYSKRSGLAFDVFSARGRPSKSGRAMDLTRGVTTTPAEAMPMAAAGAVDGLGVAGPQAPLVEPTVRSQFADTAFWTGDLLTDAEGHATINLTMPENLTTWKIRTWAMGAGTRVGEDTHEVLTTKDLLVRLEAPRFFVEKDEVVLSAIVHNKLPHEKAGAAELVLEGDTLEFMEGAANPQSITIAANGEVRIDWRVKAIREGEAHVTVKALTDEESDAMQMTFPVLVHGMLKTESFSGVIRPDEETGRLAISVPAARRPEQSLLEIRYSPTLAGAMVDALPYLADYPYGCTEQTLNRFLPTVITQNILKRMNLDLAAIRDKRTNLNPQEIGDDAARAADWARLTQGWHKELQNPVFDEAEVDSMVKKGVADLTAMQLSDGGWGWFSGWGEHSWPHTTCVVVHGLQIAQQNGVALVPDVLQRGVDWLKRYQDEQVQLLQVGEKVVNKQIQPEPGLRYRTQADNLDAFVYMVLVDAGTTDAEMQRFLYRDRTKLSLYAAAMFGLALDKQQQVEQRDMIVRNIGQFVVTDNENQTTYIDLPDVGGYWWYWYGDTIEANAYYLKLLTRVNPQDPQAAGLVKYLLNNRRHATYWNSTRDTSVCIEAMAEYLVASGESQPRMLVEVWIDGQPRQSVEITPETLFAFNNKFVVLGPDLADGDHIVELRKKPLGGNLPEDRKTGPLYYNAYLTNFTLEDPIAAAGLEIKVGRKFYRLTQRKDATALVEGSSGQAINQKTLKYDRQELASLDQVTSGDLLEVELEIDSKNDYEYVIFEDLKAAGCEAVELQSGYTSGGLGAYVEFRDQRVSFFLRELARGKHSVSYRLRAEIPGQFSALPTRAYAMYAPELKANSDEMKLKIADMPGRD